MRETFGKYRVVYSHLWRTYGSSWLVRLSYFLQVIGRLCKLVALPVAVSLIIARLSARDYDGAQQAVLIFVLFSFILGVVTPLIKYVGMLGENKIYNRSTAEYFSKLVTADIEYFNSNLSGYLTAATRQYVDSCVILTRSLRDKYVPTILTILFPLVVILWLDVWLGLVTLALSIIQAGYLLWASKAINPHRSRARELYKINSGRMADVISNILAVRSAAQEESYSERVRSGAILEADAFKQRYTMQAKLIALREVITVAVFTVLLWLTVQRMAGGFIDITAAILVVTYTTTILTGIYSLSDNLDEHDDLLDKILPGLDILNRQNRISDPDKPAAMKRVKGDIALEEVVFSYEEKAPPIFKGFSLHIPHGQKVGIVGLSGAGKSTLVKLLLRFNDVDSGRVLLDGYDIRTVKQTELRTQVAYVPQEPLLFHASIRDNVMVSRPNASEEEVIRALKAAHAWEFVRELSDGLDSVVGERGVKLSGGQKQRVAIARAVIKDAPIMILDEATSALDSESEHIIKDSFTKILKGRTAIVVAHRLSTLSGMDRIIVIQHGKLVEDGTHQQLVAEGGAYARLWRRQQRFED